MNFLSPVLLSAPWRRPFFWSRVAVGAVFLIGTVFLTVRSLFPTIEYRFDFRTPQSTKNTFLDPRSPDGALIKNGKISPEKTLLGTLGAYGIFDRGRIEIDLEKKSADAIFLEAVLRRGYRGFLQPEGPPFSDADPYPWLLASDRVFVADDTTTYLVRNGVSRRFVSRNALESYSHPAPEPIADLAAFVRTYPLATDWMGFRPGTLLSFADGVFIVTGDREVRPFGDAEIFLRMGYRFSDVLPATGEEVGFYERGRIILPGTLHPDGTSFLDERSGGYSVLTGGVRRPITDPSAIRSLHRFGSPIPVSSDQTHEAAHCAPIDDSLFSRTYTCDFDPTVLTDRSGSDFEVRLSTGTTIDIREIRVSLRTARTEENFSAFLGDMKTRLLSRFGYAD